MADLNKNLSIGWYGTCDGCTDFSFYESNGDLKSGVSNIVSVIQIKSGGFVYTSWSYERDQAQREEWELLPDALKSSIDKVDFVKDGQGIQELKCGNPYLIKMVEGTETTIENLHLAGLGDEDAGRVVECVECPTHPECVCEE
jgi:hypothetical protein